jgi:hypothetical protein
MHRAGVIVYVAWFRALAAFVFETACHPKNSGKQGRKPE